MAILNSLLNMGESRLLGKVYLNDIEIGNDVTVANDLTVDGDIISNGTLSVGKSTAANAIIYLNNKVAIKGVDTWLKINDTKAFTSGIDTGTSLVKTGAGFQVGSSSVLSLLNTSGNTFNVPTTITYATNAQTGTKALTVNGDTNIFGSMTVGTVNATTESIGKLDVENANVYGTLRAAKYSIETVQNLGGHFLVCPTIEVPSNPTGFSCRVTKTSSTTLTIGFTDNSLSTDTFEGATWAPHSKVKVTGMINNVSLGTCDGAISSWNKTNKVVTVSVTCGADVADNFSTDETSYPAAQVSDLSIMLYELCPNPTEHPDILYPIGIFLTAYGKNKYSYIDVYGGTSATPVARMGKLDKNGTSDLPTVNGITPTGWGFYAGGGSNGSGGGYFGGKLVSPTGIIGGWTIGEKALTSGTWGTANSAMLSITDNNDAAKKVGGSTSALNTWVFTAGANFGVTKTGDLYANSAHISGEITATSGSIANSVKIGGDNGIAASTVLSNIADAATTASKYITAVDQSGIKVHAENNPNANYSLINAEGMTVYNESVQRAKFGEETYIGKPYVANASNNEAHMELDYRSIELFDKENVSFFRVGDLRDRDGYTTITLTHVIDVSTGTINLSPAASRPYNSNTVVVIDTDGNDVSNSYTKNWTPTKLAFTPGLSEGYTVTITYKTNATTGKSFSFGTHSTNIYGSNSFRSGTNNIASGSDSHAEGSNTTASGMYSHAEGYSVEASADASHAEGVSTKASGKYSHAEGGATKASAVDSHAEGFGSKASGKYSHAQGFYTIASQESQTALGKYNIEPTAADNFAVILGNGTGNSTSQRSNALTVEWNGNVVTAGNISGVKGTFSGAVTGASYSGGAISGTTGTFTGAIIGASYSGGAISGTTGAFTSDVSGVKGTFSGAVTGASYSGGAISGTTGTFSSTLNVTDVSTFGGDVVPSDTNSKNLGVSANRWAATYTKHIFMGLPNFGDSAAVISSVWADGNNHNLLERSDDGLTSYFGWASSTYQTDTRLRGYKITLGSSGGGIQLNGDVTTSSNIKAGTYIKAETDITAVGKINAGAVKSYDPTWASGQDPVRYSCVVSAGLCAFSFMGAAVAHPTGTKICDLPAGARPKTERHLPFIKMAGGVIGVIQITTGGVVKVIQITNTTNTGRIYFNCSYPVV